LYGGHGGNFAGSLSVGMDHDDHHDVFELFDEELCAHADVLLPGQVMEELQQQQGDDTDKCVWRRDARELLKYLL